MKFGIVFTFLAFQASAFPSSMDTFSKDSAKPMYRRVVQRNVNKIYNFKSPEFDSLAQKRAGTFESPSVYYDPEWTNWNRNSLMTNMLEDSSGKAGGISIIQVQNPIMTSSDDDIFMDVFRRMPSQDNSTSSKGGNATTSQNTTSSTTPPPIYNSKYLLITSDGFLQFKLPGMD